MGLLNETLKVMVFSQKIRLKDEKSIFSILGFFVNSFASRSSIFHSYIYTVVIISDDGLAKLSVGHCSAFLV